ncbi:unnamed protein product [Phaedon cochleariae]|uniref:Uncharacterized protein n=1 Tax=Phaedon cochleariae TaxID=80249 RepID=A0A9N9SGM1_PHACE|nr:unnamed protein product [Phaedon cochleariae]
MGCGHSKINIYPRKSKSKTGSKKSVTADKTESEDEDGIELEADHSENIEDCDSKKTSIKLKHFGGPLLAQAEISTSQQDFFKMLDEKIQNGPDYNSESESERAAETTRLRALLKDWETASIGSRSLPPTPRRRPPRSADGGAYVSQIPQSVIHQSYGVAQTPFRPTPYANPNYVSQSPSHQMAYPSAMQYQAISPMYASQPTYQAPPLGNVAKHAGYDAQTAYSPSHKGYGVPVAVPAVVLPGSVSGGGVGKEKNNGEVLKKTYNYQHAVQYQQYKEAREQVLAQNQPAYRGAPRSYQSSVTIAVAGQGGQQGDPSALQRQQYELT